MLWATKIWALPENVRQTSSQGCKLQFLQNSRSAMAYALSPKSQANRTGTKRNTKDQTPHRNKGRCKNRGSSQETDSEDPKKRHFKETSTAARMRAAPFLDRSMSMLLVKVVTSRILLRLEPRRKM